LAESDDILHVDIKPDDVRPTLVISGEIDLVSSARLRAAIDEALALGAASLEFDFSHVSFMDSTGLGILASTSDRAMEAGGSVRVRGASPTVVRLLEVSRLDSVIDVA
jgi:anti-sigma B factor antagonist